MKTRGKKGRRSPTPKKKAANPPRLSRGVISVAERQRLFLEAIGTCGSITGAAQAAGITRSTHYEWLKSAEYATAYEASKAEAIDTLERAIHARAVEKSDLLAMFILKAANPAKYRDNYRGGGKGDGEKSVEEMLEEMAKSHGLTDDEPSAPAQCGANAMNRSAASNRSRRNDG